MAVFPPYGASKLPHTTYAGIITTHTLSGMCEILSTSGKRLVKTPKIYFYDTGLVCYLNGIENEKQLTTHPLRGAIFENLAVLEFLKKRFNAGKDANIYYYRDQSREVDILQEFGNQFHAYELKSAKAFHSAFLDNLKYLKSVMGGELLTKTQVIYDGDTDINTPENGMINIRNIF